MNLRPLGDSDLEVSEISLGAWLTYAGGIEREQTEACTRAAFEAGINFFDTANAYGRGAAETAWGEILADYPRDSYVLATKVFFPMSDSDQGPVGRPRSRKQLDASLTRLQTDYIDLYQCHRFDVETPIEETMEALSEAVRSGKVRHIGFSEWTPEQIEAGLAVPGDGQVRLLPAPVLDAVARARGRAHPALRGQRHLPGLLVAAGPGRADGQIPSRRAAAGRLACGQRRDGQLHRPAHGRRHPAGRAAPEADRRARPA